MYSVLIILIVILVLYLLYSGISRKKKKLITGGVALAIAGYLFFWLMDFWGEMLWFRSLGFESRFWTFELTRLGFTIGGFVVGFLVIFLATTSLKKVMNSMRYYAGVIGGLATAAWGSNHWGTYLRYANRVESGLNDPILSMDTGFYLFTLPFIDALLVLLLLLAIITLIGVLAGGFNIKKEGENIELVLRSNGKGIIELKIKRTAFVLLGIIALILASMKYIDRYHLLFSEYGVVSGPGWTDVNVRLPALTIISIFTFFIALVFFIPGLRAWSARVFGRIYYGFKRSWLWHAAGIFVFTFVIWFIGLTVIPGLFQLLRVEPNELRAERPYIEHNISFTRKAFALDRVEEREFPVTGRFTEQTLEDNRLLFDNIRLWDYRVLEQVYKQFQEIRLYYEFDDVDIDRYTIDDEYRQVMVSAREMELRNLPERSQTFVNERFIYTHGMGITLTGVSEFTDDGLPKLLIRDIPPVTDYPELELRQPRIYYGELTRTHVIVNSDEEEFDYPLGDENVYYRYTGDGGVEFRNFWRRLLFGWKFDGTRLLFSGIPNKDSRVLFHRQISERVKNVAPFLTLDDDPYIAAINGELMWIVDAYTTSTYFPYSEPFDAGEHEDITGYDLRTSPDVKWDFHGKNYLRNSVKAIVNAYTGEVDLYIFEEEDPVIRVWNNIVPGLFKSKEEMPPEVREHLRYPIDMLATQGLVFARYHMTNPTVFYNQEDLWVRATENYYGREEPVEPYYIMWDPPEANGLEYILMQPFTPKTRQVAIGWIAGMSDGENYGRFLAYKFPKEKRVLGPQQFETRIDQDAHLSGQLSLWDQRGSRVIRGNVLVIPVEETLVYVEPIYLEAEAAAYPELRLVVTMHEDRISYADNFEDAIRGLFEDPEEIEPVAPDIVGIDELIRQADQAFEDYLRHTGARDFEMASEALRELEEAIRELNRLQQEPE